MTKITGDGFSKEEFSEIERAQHREMFREFEKDFPFLRPMDNAFRSGKTLAVVFGTMAVLAGAIRWAVSQGWFS